MGDDRFSVGISFTIPFNSGKGISAESVKAGCRFTFEACCCLSNDTLHICCYSTKQCPALRYGENFSFCSRFQNLKPLIPLKFYGNLL